jgi:hypothetical protein
VLVDQVGVGAAMFAVNVGGCGGPAAIFGHDLKAQGFALGFKMGGGKSKIRVIFQGQAPRPLSGSGLPLEARP